MSTLKVDTLDTRTGSGNITVSRPLAGSGASLTALNATELTSGTLPMARLSGTLPALNGSALTNLPAHSGNVAFPASQSASSNVNTLDDYEAGTWTPVLDAVGATNSVSYSSQSGHYVKIGKIVMCNFFIALSNKGSWSSPGVIKGFPFTFANVGYNKGGGAGGGWYGMSTSLYWLGLKGYPGLSHAYLRATSSAGTASGGLGSGDFGNSAELSLSFNYVASS